MGSPRLEDLPEKQPTPEIVVEQDKKPGPVDRVDSFFRDLGPGLITGCADDDPSGIATYSVAGAAFGYATLWTALLSFPLMIAVQMMCSRLGMVTGRGLASVIRLHYPRWVLWGACSLLVTANVINIAADLGGMGQSAALVTGLSANIWTVVFTAIMVSFLFWSSYRQIARVFKWITLVLLAYVVTAFFAHVDWRSALIATILPRVSWSRESLSVLVGILGTTISPYLFFWQAAQEVEEERAQGRNLMQRKGATDGELRRARLERLRHCRGFGLERVPGEEASWCAALLYGGRISDDRWSRDRFRRARRRQNDVLGGGRERRVSSTPHFARGSAYQQSTGHGRAHQLSRFTGPRLDHPRSHDCGDDRHAGELTSAKQFRTNDHSTVSILPISQFYCRRYKGPVRKTGARRESVHTGPQADTGSHPATPRTRSRECSRSGS